MPDINVFELIGGEYTDANGNKQLLSTFLADPNPPDGGMFPAEDLFLYIELTARPRSRSIILSQDTNSEFVSTGNDYSRPVSFITTTKQNGKDYVTTNFINVDGDSSSIEGFGIQSIDIDIGADYTPQVEIKFFDVRAGGFKEFDDYGGSIFSDSPLSVFFKLPYPIFELKIKGYYGKAVTYCLSLLNWSATFDTTSGGFVINAKFIGYTYAFLADIPMKHIWAISQTPQGREKLKGTGIIPFSEMLSKFGQLTRVSEEFKRDSSEFLKLKVYNSALAKLREIQRLIGQPIADGSSQVFTTPINADGIAPNRDQVFIRDVGILNEEKYDEYLVFSKEINNLLAEYENYASQLGEQGMGRVGIPTLGTEYPYDVAVNRVRSILEKSDKSFNATIVTTDKVDEVFAPISLSNNILQELKFYILDFIEPRKTVSEKTVALEKKKLDVEKLAIKQLNETAIKKIGFSPTVENIFEIICGNVDAYLSVLYDYSFRAASPQLEEKRRAGLSSNVTDISVAYSNKIHPFPDVVGSNDEKIYIGSIAGIEKSAYPEIEITDILINGINNIYTEQSEANYIDYISTAITNDEETFFPSNPLDFGESIYDELNIISGGRIMTAEFVNILLEKFYAYYNIANVTDIKMLLAYAKIEANSMLENIINPTVRDLINNEPNFTQNVVAIASDILDNFSKSSIVINNYDLNEQDIFIRSQNTSLYESVTNNNVQLSDRVNEIFSTINIKRGNHAGFSPNYLIEKDYSYKFREVASQLRIQRYVTEDPSNKINSFSENELYDFIVMSKVTGLHFIDGDNLLYFGDDNVLSTGDGRLFYKNGVRLDITLEYLFSTSYDRYFQILETMGFQMDTRGFFREISNYVGIAYLSAQWMHYVGALYYRLDNNMGVISEGDGFFEIDGHTVPVITDSLKNKFIKYFTDYVETGFTVFEENLVSYKKLKAKNILSTDDPDYRQLALLYNEIVDDLNAVETIVIANTGKNNVPSQTLLEQYFDTFITEYKSQVKVAKSTGAGVTDNSFDAPSTFDDDFKLAVYDSLKGIYDKWLAYGGEDGRIYNNCFDPSNRVQGGETKKSLFDYFHFVDRAWSDIGDRAIINPKILMGLTVNQEETLYGFITKLLNDSKFLVYFAPSFVGNRTLDDLRDMFMPHTTVNDAYGGSSVIAMYTGGNSRNLEIPAGEFGNDGFNFEVGNVYPKKFSERKVATRHVSLPEEKVKYNISAFLVEYAKENQSHFTEINVSTEEHYNTNEYLLALHEAVDRGGNTKRFYKGVDLYNIYNIRSYKSTVTSLGNMMLQPMGYYQLNIPFFRGAYLITKVTHSITPHHHETKFMGYRMPSYTYPLVEDITSFIKLAPNEIFDMLLSDSDPVIFVEGSDGNDSQLSSTISSNRISEGQRSDNTLFNITIIK